MESIRARFGHIAPIEGLRGIAVLWVVAFHYVVVREGVFPSDPWIALAGAAAGSNVMVHHGYLGVDLFFLITGFLLVLPWLRAADGGPPAPGAREFYVRRAYRILPAYYVHLLVLFFVFLPLLRTLAYWKTDLAFYLFNLSAHVTMLHYTTPLTSASLGLNGALWTLALEAQWYLLLPLVAPLFARAPWPTAAALFGAAIAWRWLAWHDMEALVALQTMIGAPWNPSEEKMRHLVATQLPAYFGHFAVGMLVGRAWLRRRHTETTQSGVRTLSAAIAVAAAVFVLYRMHAPGGVWFGDFNWVLIPLAMGAAMAALVVAGGRTGAVVLGNAPLQFVGRISYSMYLYHLPLLLAWNKFAPVTGWGSLPAYLAIVGAVAYASWRWVEVPYLSGGRRAPRAEAHRQRGDDGEALEQRHAP